MDNVDPLAVLRFGGDGVGQRIAQELPGQRILGVKLCGFLKGGDGVSQVPFVCEHNGEVLVAARAHILGRRIHDQNLVARRGRFWHLADLRQVRSKLHMCPRGRLQDGGLLEHRYRLLVFPHSAVG